MRDAGAADGPGTSVHEEQVAWDGPLVAAWQRLADRTAAPYFRRPEWVRAWSEVHAPAARLTALVDRGADGEVRGLLCLARRPATVPGGRTLPLPVLQQAGAGPGAADHCGPVARDDASRDRLLAAASALPGGVLLLAQCADAPLPQGARVLARRAVPALRLTGSGAVDGWPKRVRQDVRRCRRRAEEAGVAMRWLGPDDPRLAAGVASLSALHALRYGPAREARRRRVLLRAAALATPGCGPRLLQAVRGEEVVGALLTFLDPAGSRYYQLGWDPVWAPLSLGRLLVVEAVEQAERDGLPRFDFLRGDEPYKSDLGAVDAEDVDVVVGSGPGLRVELGLQALRARVRRAAA